MQVAKSLNSYRPYGDYVYTPGIARLLPGRYLGGPPQSNRSADGRATVTHLAELASTLVLLRSPNIVHQHQDAPLYEHVSRVTKATMLVRESA